MWNKSYSIGVVGFFSDKFFKYIMNLGTGVETKISQAQDPGSNLGIASCFHIVFGPLTNFHDCGYNNTAVLKSLLRFRIAVRTQFLFTLLF